jgi:hypothetical protein
VKISPCVPFPCAETALFAVLITHIIPRCQIYVAIDNSSLFPSLCWLTTSRYLCNCMGVADNVSHTENLQTDGCWCFSHWYKLRDGIHLTRVSRYYGGSHCQPVLNKSSIHILEVDIEWLLHLPRKTPIHHALTAPQALFYPHLVIVSVPSAPVLASCTSIHLRYAFTISTLNLNPNSMVNTKVLCMNLFIPYIRLVTTHMGDKLVHAAVYCHAVH